MTDAFRATVRFRHFWGKDKHRQLITAAEGDGPAYTAVAPRTDLGLNLRPLDVADTYRAWPSLTDLMPKGIPGINTSRDRFLVDIDEAALRKRLDLYFDPEIENSTIAEDFPQVMTTTKRFKAVAVRRALLAAGIGAGSVVPYTYQPFDRRWLYWEPSTKLLDEKRPELFAAMRQPNRVLICRPRAEREREGSPFLVVSALPDRHLTRPGSVAFPERYRPDNATPLLESVPELAPNLSPWAAAYLAEQGPDEPGDMVDPAPMLHHILAIGHAPAYHADHGDAVREAWPRIPLPASRDLFAASAALGARVAALLDDTVKVPGVTASPIRRELTVLGPLARVPGAKTVDKGISARWGYAGRDDICMPGPGDARPRPFTERERGAIAAGAASLGLAEPDALALLGGDCLDIHLNPTTLWTAVPRAVWDFHLGGYQVIKKWLSYRERALLGRDLTDDETGHVTGMARRIAALLLLGPELDANYRACAEAPGWFPG